MTAVVPSNLPITLTFQVGEVRVALADLLQLAPGSVLEGDQLVNYFPKVRAILSDRAVAEGELISIDGKVGFRVTKIL